MTHSYQYTTSEGPVAAVFGEGVDVAVITTAELDKLRSCVDFVETSLDVGTYEQTAERVRKYYGADAPVLSLLED